MDRTELQTTAALAHIFLEEEESRALTDMADQMLAYFSKMLEMDVEGLSPTTHAFQEENVLRRDELRTGNPEALLNRAPERDDRFITIPNVL